MLNIRVAITGSSGFIGSNFINSANDKFAEFFALKRSELLTFDYSKVDVVVHFAAIAHTSGVSSDQYFSINRDLTINIAQRAKKSGVKHFIFLSSVKVYGNEKGCFKPISLNTKPNPADDYGKSKLEAEEGLKRVEDENFCVSIIRTPLVYGPGVKANMLGMMKMVKKCPFLPFKDVNNKRSFIYVGNLVSFINKIIEKRLGGIFLVSDGNPMSTEEMINLISKKMDRKIFLFKLPSVIKRLMKMVLPSTYQKLFCDFVADQKDSFEKVDFMPQFSVDEGIGDMVNWYFGTK